MSEAGAILFAAARRFLLEWPHQVPMRFPAYFFSSCYFSVSRRRVGALAGALLIGVVLRAAPVPSAPAAQQSQPVAAAATVPESAPSDSATEDELKEQLLGKPLYLRGGYLSDTLNFDEHGRLVSHSLAGSYTLSVIEIEKVRLSKHKLELEGIRYGLHFLGALPYEDPAKAVDRVRITPKKKMVRITIDRERVEKPKKQKEKGKKKHEGQLLWARKDEDLPPPGPLPEASEGDESAQASGKEEGPADAKSVTTTTSPAHALAMLKGALDAIFAQGLDERMKAAMPAFWQLYYQAAAAKTDYRPRDPAVLRQNTVDKKAALLTPFEPKSNPYAQSNGIAGMALYHVVVGADGKPGEIAVARPIGFGLDENAVEAIQAARFRPAIKDGKDVPVMLDLVVEFRIYSKLTDRVGPKPGEAAPGPAMPGPYTLP